MSKFINIKGTNDIITGIRKSEISAVYTRVRALRIEIKTGTTLDMEIGDRDITAAFKELMKELDE